MSRIKNISILIFFFMSLFIFNFDAKSEGNGSASADTSDTKLVFDELVVLQSLETGLELSIEKIDAQSGKVIAPNHALATKYFRIAANKGNPIGQYLLGYNYLFGNGIPKDIKQAINWLEKAALQDDIDAQKLLASIFFAGVDVPKDNESSVFWTMRAAKNGDQTSIFLIANILSIGDGLPQDVNKANDWYRKAIEINTDPSITEQSRKNLERNIRIQELEKELETQIVRTENAKRSADLATKNHQAWQEITKSIIEQPKNSAPSLPVPKTIRCQHIGNQTTCREF